MIVMRHQNNKKDKQIIFDKNKLITRIASKSSFLSRKGRNKKVKQLFENAFYRNQLADDVDDSDLVDDFCLRGWKAGLNPHPLFDVTYYLSANPDVERAGVNPLLHYLEFGVLEKRNPHPLFDIPYYLSSNPDVEQSRANPLLHYLESGAFAKRNPHPLFDAEYYLSSNADVEQARVNPLLHYISAGAFEKRNPHPLFDADYYSKNFEESRQRNINFLLHYLSEGAAAGLNPHPGFESEYYRKRYSLDIRVNPLIDYLQHPDRNPSSWFNPHYLFDLDDLNIDETNPLVYALYGISIPRCPRHEDSDGPTEEELDSSENTDSKKPLIYIVSHDATRTGAPAIILNIARHLSYAGTFEIVVFMHKGGPLLKEFQAIADVVCLEKITQLRGGREIQDRAMKWYCRCKPVLAIVNSLESSYFASIFGESNIPVLTLIHEFVTSYEEDLVSRVIKNSRKIIFPSLFVKNIAIENYSLDDWNYTVISQGLLNPGFGTMDVDQAREEVREELGLPRNAFIVLGCGSVTFRKGPDLFVQAAALMQRLYGRDDIFYLWLGKTEQELFFAHYLERDIERLGLQGRIIFAGEKANVEPYFVGADLFLLTSREDPFPCVVHEAMAASLPAIVFSNSGGAAEAVGDAGIAVPFGDIPAVAESIFKLYLNSSLRLSYGIMAKQRVHTHFNFDAYYSLLAEYIKAEFEIDMDIEPPRFSEPKPLIAIPSGALPGDGDDFNYIVETKTRSRKRVMSQPVFIAGTTRSGTSIIKLVLRRVFGDFGPHEGHLWPLYGELHKKIDEYFDRHEEHLEFSTTLAQAGRETVKSAICNVFDSFHLDNSLKFVFVDKSPGRALISSLPFIQIMYPDARIIFMKRHGVSNIESKQRKFPDRPFDIQCLSWKKNMEEWLKVRSELKHFIEIDQGKLLAYPEECAEQLADFLELTVTQKEEILRSFKERRIEKTSAGRAITRKLSETSWTEEEKEYFVTMCGQLMLEYGYDY